jgi:hypothetical protein
MVGGVIFPNNGFAQTQAEIDVFYATLPGDPAYELKEEEAIRRYRGVFTECLLKAVSTPESEVIESLPDGTQIITSWRLKDYLQSTVPVEVARADIRLRQIPDVRVGARQPPKFFARVDPATPIAKTIQFMPPVETFEMAVGALGAELLPPGEFVPSSAVGRIPFGYLAKELGLMTAVDQIVMARGREHFETETGFTVHGADVTAVHASSQWTVDAPFRETAASGAHHVRVAAANAASDVHPSTILLELDNKTGVALAILPGFVGSLVVEGGRVVSVSYVPSANTDRFAEYQIRARELERMKGFAAVAARNGQFVVTNEDAVTFANRIRQAKGIDPTMGIYAAYAYAQVGQYKDVHSVFSFMQNDDPRIPVPFDVVMLATRSEPNAHAQPFARPAPFGPLLSQGWALLLPGDAMHKPIHEEVRPHLLPSLWTTFDAEGVAIAAAALARGDIQ